MATHSHPHPHPHPHSPGPSPGPGPMPINPALTALLDSIPTNTLPFALVSVPLPIPPNATLPPGATPPTQTLVVCPTHKNVICEQCGVDYGGLNYMQQFLKDAPTEAVPPPPNMQPPQGRADAIKNAKDAGNRPAWEYIIYGSPGMGKKEARGTRDELNRRPETAFKANNFPTAIRAYSQSADMALSRPPWELAALGREETAIALCNRSAAFALAGEWVNALADAEAVVTLKRPWTRGHYRRARALVGLNRYEEARQAAVDGLQYEPNDKDLNAVLKEMDSKIVEQA